MKLCDFDIVFHKKCGIIEYDIPKNIEKTE